MRAFYANKGLSKTQRIMLTGVFKNSRIFPSQNCRNLFGIMQLQRIVDPRIIVKGYLAVVENPQRPCLGVLLWTDTIPGVWPDTAFTVVDLT